MAQVQSSFPQHGSQRTSPNRKQQREDARVKARNTAKGNGYELRLKRIHRQREERELAEEQRARRTARIVRERKRDNSANQNVRGWLDRAGQKVKALCKTQNLKDMKLEIAMVVVIVVFTIATVPFWLNVSIGIHRLKETHDAD